MHMCVHVSALLKEMLIVPTRCTDGRYVDNQKEGEQERI